MMIRNSRMILCALALLSAIGCQSDGGSHEPLYGSQKRNVTLKTAPARFREVAHKNPKLLLARAQ